MVKHRTYVCTYDSCQKSYFTLKHLRRHEAVHENCFQCPVEGCGITLKSKATLKNHHDNIHLKKKPKKYKCPQCDQEFSKHNWLTRHQYRHTGVLPYVCSEEGCEKRFLLPSRLKRHVKTHKGYTCDRENCGKIFRTWTLFTSHRKTHPIIHKCPHCDKAFSTTSNLKMHAEVHNLDRKVFLCPKPNCSSFYMLERNLKHHIKSYHEKRPFICTQEHCHKAFKSEAHMIAHCSQHDPNKRKRKKKKKSKPSFAARLAGLAPKKWQLKSVDDLMTENKEGAHEDNISGSEKKQDEIELTVNEIVEINNEAGISEDYTSNSEECQDEQEITSLEKDIPSQSSRDTLNLSGVGNSSIEKECSADYAIQVLLNSIEKREEFGTESTVKKTKHISLKA